MNSITNDFNLKAEDAVDKFETLVGTGASMKESATICGFNYPELAAWIRDKYNVEQAEMVYTRLKLIAYEEYKGVLNVLAAKGNASAITTVNTYVHKMGEETRTVNIRFVTNMNEETEEDKKDNGDKGNS